MSANLVLIDLLGAGALLLWGLRMVKTGVTRAFGSSLRHWIALGTTNRFKAFFAGLAATIAVQSSTATALITASFASRELMTTAMAQAIMIGANVGTAMVTRLLALNLHWLSPVLILCGVATFMASDSSRPKAIGRAIIGLGLMLLSLQLIGAATEPMRASPTLQSLLAALGAAPVIGLLVAAVLAFVASSSLAIVLLVASLAASSNMDAGLVVALVLGANLGGAVPPALATAGYGPLARRVTLGNLAVRGAGCLLALPLIGPIDGYLARAAALTGNFAVDVHLAFNIALALLFLPLVGLIARLAERLMPPQPEDRLGPRYLDTSSLDTPAVALSCAARETLRIGDVVEVMLVRSLEALRNNDAKLKSEIAKMDDEVDALQQAVKLYLSRLGHEGLDDEDARKATEIISYAINLEHIGDIIDKSLLDMIAKKIKYGLRFSREGMAEIEELHARTLENLRIAQSIFISRDMDLARKLVEVKVDVRHMERLSAERHLERLREGRIESIQSSTLHLDVLRDLKQINAHITSVAYPILDEAGALRESRLRGDGKAAVA
ncbi:MULTISPECIES: Na/Pi cotransporter family protein [unclassified Chelatococcus]|uniref:Na/Pi cotransporter family protein n=1 Tax=unclassified Chelatococcus TaxID=2638111 RepID=UPI0003054E75|nr:MULTISPECIES: Na/Pi cotransporter family protein [unclassified Chelatococcus]ALA17899.1 sodium:phosphate symporter [Chelatococcus sp. CO-6]